MSHDADHVDPALQSSDSRLSDSSQRPVKATLATGPVAQGGDKNDNDAHLEEDGPHSPSNCHGTSDDDPPTPQHTHEPNHHHDALVGGLDDAKRPRACEACRGLKVRCVPDPTDPDGPCGRCKKAGRKCIVTFATRKRQKKTDSRVSELEKKIDALTATLLAKNGLQSDDSAWDEGTTIKGRASGGFQPYSQSPPRPEATAASTSVSGPAADGPLQGQKRKAEDQDEEQPDFDTQPPLPQPSPNRMDGSSADIVSRGVVTLDQATGLLARYRDAMVTHMPAVLISSTTTVGELRRIKPVLFLSIMAAASSESSSLQRRLVRELMLVLAEKLVVKGEKSLELVQALQVAVIWYWPPEYVEELKFYQLIQMGAVMAIDIGLGRAGPPVPGGMAGGAARHRQRQPPYGVFAFRKSPSRRNPPVDPTTLESRRAWLTSYFLATTSATALQRPLLLRWTRFMTESVELLEKSPDAAPTDRYLCALVGTQHISEEISQQFCMDEPDPININDPRTQYALRKLEHDIGAFQKSLPKEVLKSTLKIAANMVSLYLHETVLHDGSADPPRPMCPPTLFRDTILSETSTVTTAHVNALSSCLAAIDAILDTFLGMDVASIRCLPVFNFMRVVYALIVLIKIYLTASNRDSELSAIMDPDGMRVEFYMDALLEKFRATAADDKSRPAAKFLVVIAMLKGWVLKNGKRESVDESRPAPSTQTGRPGKKTEAGRRQRQPDNTSTPLHVLSEVATNGRDNGSSSNMPDDSSFDQGAPGFTSAPTSRPHLVSRDPDEANDTHAASTGEAGSSIAGSSTMFPTGVESLGPTPPGTYSTGFSPFYMANLTQNLSFEELTASLGMDDGSAGLFSAPPMNFGEMAGGGGTEMMPGFMGEVGGPSGASGGETSADGAGNNNGGNDRDVEREMRSAMAQDPWFGQWGNVLEGMPPPATWSTNSWPRGGAPPFQM